jgi:predicted nuclease with TOPRIM domain
VEKNENLTKELSICHDTISNLRTENVSLIAKVDKLNESISSLKDENARLISKAKDLNVCNVSEKITMPKRGGELGFSKNQH